MKLKFMGQVSISNITAVFVTIQLVSQCMKIYFTVEIVKNISVIFSRYFD